jgi:chromosomal replication initiator protein
MESPDRPAPAPAEEAWQACLGIIRDNVKRQSYKTWFEPLEALSLKTEDGLQRLTVQLPSRFYYEWLEEHYFALLRKTVIKVLGDDGRLFYEVVIEQNDARRGREGSSMRLPARRPSEQHADAPKSRGKSRGTPSAGGSAPQGGGSSQQNEQPDPALRPERRKRPGRPADQSARSAPQTGRRGGQQQSAEPDGHTPAVQNPFAIPGLQKANVDAQLNESYTFERFIEGDCNQLARGASWAIAQEPGSTRFNPFLIYGGVGLGKTHLIQAIGNHVEQSSGGDSVLYVSSERFTTEFVQAIQNNRINEFSMFYRQIDLLIVDDVQFFGGKEKTQEEFFHIFNALHQNGKQIVMSADRSPREIDGIEERLLSRFQWGLSADVQPPELETRIAILRRKAEDDGIELPQEIIEFMAHNIKSNIRELEGALIRLMAHATLHSRDMDLSLAKDVLRDLVTEARSALTVDEIQRIVCEHLAIEEDDLRGKTRKRDIVRARQIAMFFCKALTGHSLKTIGLHFGGRDHSTVIHSNNRVEEQMEVDPQFKKTVEDLRRKIDLRSR